MPIYEFYCAQCHMVFNFFSTSIDTKKIPVCPQCGETGMERYMSVFSTPRDRNKEEDIPLPDLDENKMEKAMSLLAKEAEHINENDPRQAADLMRKFTDMTGLDLGPGLDEALNRMEAGEDPAQIEEDMGDILGEDPFSLKKKNMAPARYYPPKVDEKLYDL